MNKKKPDSLQSPDREAPSSVSSSRRHFLRAAALSVVGGSAALATGCKYQSQFFLLSRAPTTAKQKSPEWQEAQVRSYRPLGRTGMQMSDISFGCSGLDNVAVVKRAL